MVGVFIHVSFGYSFDSHPNWCGGLGRLCITPGLIAIESISAVLLWGKTTQLLPTGYLVFMVLFDWLFLQSWTNGPLSPVSTNNHENTDHESLHSISLNLSQIFRDVSPRFPLLAFTCVQFFSWKKRIGGAHLFFQHCPYRLMLDVPFIWFWLIHIS